MKYWISPFLRWYFFSSDCLLRRLKMLKNLVVYRPYFRWNTVVNREKYVLCFTAGLLWAVLTVMTTRVCPLCQNMLQVKFWHGRDIGSGVLLVDLWCMLSTLKYDVWFFGGSVFYFKLAKNLGVVTSHYHKVVACVRMCSGEVNCRLIFREI